MFHWGIFGDYAPSEETKADLSSFSLQPPRPLQEPEDKRIIQELLETEQAYVARLHLLDQASDQDGPTWAPASESLHSNPALLIRAES